MGLYTTALVNVLQTVCRHDIRNKSLCMIGRQEILIEWEHFMKIIDSMRLSYDKNIYNHMKGVYPINTYEFFRMFGFREVHAIDYNELDGADIIFNLNDDLPEDLHQKYDYIIDSGTLEHVFDVAKAIKNVSAMLRQGGMIIHILPLGGYVDHGFYSFSPTFFLDYYPLNGFYIHRINMEFMLGEIGSLKNSREYAGFDAIYSQDCRLFSDDWRDWVHKQINLYIKQIEKLEKVGHIYLWCIAERNEIKNLEYPIQGMYQRKENQLKKKP